MLADQEMRMLEPSTDYDALVINSHGVVAVPPDATTVSIYNIYSSLPVYWTVPQIYLGDMVHHLHYKIVHMNVTLLCFKKRMYCPWNR